MADLPSDETELAYSTDTLLQLNSGEKTSVGEECPTMYKLKQYLRQPRRGVRFTTANPRELRVVGIFFMCTGRERGGKKREREARQKAR